MNSKLDKLLPQVKRCRLCEDQFSHSPRPVLQVNESASVLIAGQAPGAKVHTTGIPFNDPSGDRLRTWMGIDKDTFYNDAKIAILPMAFCYPGKGSSGDLPPPSICANRWRTELLSAMPNITLTLLIGQYAQKWHLANNKQSLTERVKNNDYASSLIALPHPSPRNNIWLKKNAWFEQQQLSKLQQKVARSLR